MRLIALVIVLVYYVSNTQFPFISGAYNDDCSVRGRSWPQDLATPFPCDTSAPIDINSTTAKTMFVAPLVFTVNFVEKHYVTNTGDGVVITAEAGRDSGTTVTGSILNTTIFGFQSLTFYFAHDYNNKFAKILNGEGYPFVLCLEFFNKSYKSYNEAKQNGNGLFITCTPVKVVPGGYNPFFPGLAQIMSNIIEPNTSYTVTGPVVGFFLVGFYFLSEMGPNYFIYPGSTISRNGTRCQTVTIVQYPLPAVISPEQYNEAFSKLKSKNRTVPLENKFEIFPYNKRPVINAFGGSILTPNFNGLVQSLTDPKNITRDTQFLLESLRKRGR